MKTEYVKGKPYFSDNVEKLEQFPYLDKNIECDVLIMGGGINGAICGHYFSQDKIDTVIIDKNVVGYGNTSCATALLEYQMDDFANDLKKYFSKNDIVKAYNIGLKALNDIQKIIDKQGNDCFYSKRDTFLFSSNIFDKNAIEREFDFRINNGFNVQYLTDSNNKFNFNFKYGILAKDGGAEFNPYLFTKQLIKNRNKKYLRIFENTEATNILKRDDGYVVVTKYGIMIKCSKIVCSSGYNTSFLTDEKLCDKFISYTIVTNPLKNFSWKDGVLLQDNENPYHYIRSTFDNRIVVGGEDILFKNNVISEKVAEKKYDKLFKFLKTLFIKLPKNIKIDYKFCGAFSSTKNNLAVMGESKTNPDIWLLLGYGANGIIYSIYGAQKLVQKYHGLKDEFFEKHFSPKRVLP